MNQRESSIFGFLMLDMHPNMSVETLSFITDNLSKGDEHGRREMRSLQQAFVQHNNKNDRGTPDVYRLWGQDNSAS